MATGGGNYVCRGLKPNVTTAFRALQQTVKTIAAKMAAAGKLNVPPDLVLLAVDGDIGKITSIGVQFIGNAFAAVKPPPPDVAHAIASGISATEAVERIAAAAVEINAYFLDVLANFPEAVTKERVLMVERKFPWGVIAATVAVIALLGLGTYLIREHRTS